MNACDARVQCGTTAAVMAENSGRRMKPGSYFARKRMRIEFDVVKFAANYSRKLKSVQLLRTFAANICREPLSTSRISLRIRFRVKYEPAFSLYINLAQIRTPSLYIPKRSPIRQQVSRRTENVFCDIV